MAKTTFSEALRYLWRAIVAAHEGGRSRASMPSQEPKPDVDPAEILRQLGGPITPPTGGTIREELERAHAADQAKGADASSGNGDRLPSPEHKQKAPFLPTDIVMAAVGAFIAEPLCHAGWDGVVSGEHVERGVVAIVAGLFLGVGAASFHWWKVRVSESSRNWVRRNAVWWLPLSFVLFFAYEVGPNMYERATRPMATSSPAMWSAPNYEGGPLGWDWNDINLGLGLNPNGENSRISSFTISGKNLGTEEVDLQEAHLISGVDGATMSMKVNVAQAGTPVWVDLSEIAPVPPGAEINLSAQFGEKQGGMPEADFLRNWGTFSAVIQYNGQKVRHEFSREFVRTLLERFHPERAPHVSKKK